MSEADVAINVPTEKSHLMPKAGGVEQMSVEGEGLGPHYASEIAAASSLAVACIGAGVLALPSGFAQAGIVFAVTTVIAIGYLTILSLRYLIDVKQTMGLNSYDAMSRELMGPAAERLSQWVVLCYNLGANVGYIIVMGNILEPFRDNLTRLTGIQSFTTNPLFPQQMYWLLVMLPLSCVRNIQALSSSATLAIVASLFVSFMVVFRFFDPIDEVGAAVTHRVQSTNSGAHPYHTQGHATSYHHVSQGAQGAAAAQDGVVFHNGPEGSLVFFNFSVNAAIAVAILTFAMDCQTMVFQTYSQLKRPSMAAVTRVSIGAISTACFVYGCVGLFGYLSWRDAVNDNILLNYNPKIDFLASISYGLYAIPVTMAYALYAFPTKDMLFSMVLGTASGEFIPARQFYPASILVSLFQMLAALYFPSIAVLCALLGGLFSSLLCFIFPAGFVLQMHYKKIKSASSKFDLCQKWFLFVFGCFAMVLGTYASLVQVFQPHVQAGAAAVVTAVPTHSVMPASPRH